MGAFKVDIKISASDADDDNSDSQKSEFSSVIIDQVAW
jgi:hypothetical protein